MKNKVFFLLYITMAASILSGCRSAPTQRTERTKPTTVPAELAAELRSFTLPLIGEVATVGVGEEMLKQGEESAYEQLTLNEDQFIGGVLVRAGSYRRNIKDSDFVGYRVKLLTGGAIKIDRMGTLLIYTKDAGKAIGCLNDDCGPLKYKATRELSFAKSSFQQTLIYSGKVGSRITMGYREFSSDTARPAFNNDVTYDLNESHVLGYKGARLEVIKATNTEITYKVLAGFK